MDKRKADMLKLADAFFQALERDNCEYGGWGIHDKRPFGNSDVTGDILEIIGMKRDDEADSYADRLYDDLGAFLLEQWQEFRAGANKGQPCMDAMKAQLDHERAVIRSLQASLATETSKRRDAYYQAALAGWCAFSDSASADFNFKSAMNAAENAMAAADEKNKEEFNGNDAA